MSLGDPQTFNRYSYVTNDPINFVDPSGLEETLFRVETWTWRWLGGGSSGGGTSLPGGTWDPATKCYGESCGGGSGVPTPSDDKLPFNSCSAFVDWLVKFAERRPYQISDNHNRAKALGASLMDLAFFGYDKHAYNGTDGFKSVLVDPGEGTEGGRQGGGVYGHVMGMAGAYLTGVMTGGRIIGAASSLYDHFENSIKGKAQGPAEVAGNAAGTAAGKHIWNLIRGNGNSDNLRESLTSDLCAK